MTSPLRVLLVDDHPATREGLRSAIEAQPDLCVAGEAATWKESRHLAADLRPDVMVLDLNLPDGNGWMLLDELKAAGKLPPTLVLSVCDEQIYARRLLRAGATGYLMKDEPMETILRAIREVRQGRIVASAPISTALISEALGTVDEAAPSEGSGANIGGLSDRELQIFALFGQGLRNKEIAARLRLSEKTVSTYKVRLMFKLDVRTTPALIEHYRQWSATGGSSPSASSSVTPPSAVTDGGGDPRNA
jgi:DNA-binding NarL/FixJ family response regulator